MKKQTEVYETGATTHATNDLILFADNTKELAELRNSIYLSFARPQSVLDKIDLASRFQHLYLKAVAAYKKEFPQTDRRYFLPIGSDMANEFCQLYAADFEAWKVEHSIK